MRENKKISRHTISHDEPSRFMLIGLVTAEPDYRLSVILNRLLGTSLHHSDEVIVTRSGTENVHFSVFASSSAPFSLISNKSEGKVLIRQLRKIDYFLVLHGKPERQEAENLALKIRKSPEVTAAFVFDSAEVNDKKTGLLAR